MDHIWQWTWDRYGARYSWALCVIGFPVVLPIYLLASYVVVAFERSGRYVEATLVTVVFVLAMSYAFLPAGDKRLRRAEQWAAGHEVDRALALQDTFAYGRRPVSRLVAVHAVLAAALLVVVGAIAGAVSSRLLQYAIMGAVTGITVQLIAAHSVVQGALRPARIALAGDMRTADSLPRSRPTFAVWSNLTLLAVALAFAQAGAMVAGVFNRATQATPGSWVVIGSVLAFGFALPITVGVGFSPSLRPIRDLAEGTERVAAGDYGQRLPVVQDDDLGALAGSFNRMQAGLLERQRLQAAFGTYVDPTLAARLLEQGDDVFTGERREVSVMFVDIRDFTPFAEANTAEDTVSRLNALFEIVVPTVVHAGGHVNKFLGDGALAVFGAPNDLANHADAAVVAAVLIQRLVA
ncbi:MAG: HAMP domain-containing protein, partial [Mycobacterium sp.]|uniref:adenylate/guanylate cyclase domain-containing protein n=1 Tax=Mycobacterium sp. TaxID=1785 RepID=UPI003C4588A8